MQSWDEILARTLDDGRLTRSEREALARVLDDARPHELALVRSRAFELALGALEPRRARGVLEWYRDVIDLTIAREREQRSPSAAGGARNEAAFSPGDACVERVVSLLRASRRSVDVCVFTITDDRIRAALVEAHGRRVAVRVITDNDKAEDLGSDVLHLARCGIPVRVDRSPSHMHHKFAIYDADLLLTGSYNWTRSAAEHNAENIVVTDHRGLVRAFQREFDALWKRFE